MLLAGRKAGKCCIRGSGDQGQRRGRDPCGCGRGLFLSFSFEVFVAVVAAVGSLPAPWNARLRALGAPLADPNGREEDLSKNAIGDKHMTLPGRLKKMRVSCFVSSFATVSLKLKSAIVTSCHLTENLKMFEMPNYLTTFKLKTTKKSTNERNRMCSDVDNN